MRKFVEFEFIGRNRSAVAAAHGTRDALRDVNREAQTTSVGATRSFEGIGAASGRVASRIESGLLTTLRRATFIIGGLATAAGGFATSMGLSFYRTQQSASIAFTTILKDGTKAQRLLGQLQKFAAETPFEFPELLRASQMLLNVGFAADQILPTMESVGNAVAAAGGDPETLQGTIRALGQIQSKGRLMSEEMLQLNERAVFSWQALADQIGVEIPKAQDLVTKGAVSSEAFFAAFIANSNERFGGMMEAQSKTFSGLLSTLRDNISQTMATALTPFFRGVEVGMASINKSMSSPEFQMSIQKWGERSVVYAERVWDWIVRNRDEIANMARGAVGAAGTVVGAFGGIIRVLERIEGLVGGWDNLFLLLLSGRLALAVLTLTKRFTALAGAEAAAGAAGGGTGIAAATSRSARLLANLRAIAGFGALTVLINLVINKESVDRWGNWLDDKLGLRNFFGGGQPGGVDWSPDLGPGGGFDPSRRLPPSTAPQGPRTGRPGTGVSGGTVRGGIQVPTSHRSTHPTSGLGGYPAVDYFAKPGTPVKAPENGAITRVQGSATTAGGTYGFGVYFDGYETGNGYFIKHLINPGRPGNYKRGDVIGYVSPWADNPNAAHAHVGIRPGGGAASPSTGFGDASDLVDTSAGGSADRRGGSQKADPAAVRSLRSTITWITKNIDRLAEPARSQILAVARKLSAAISKIVTADDERNVADRVKKLMDRFTKSVNDALTKARDNFEASWEKFKDKVMEGFEEVGNIIDRMSEFASSELDRIRNLNREGAAQAVIDAALGVDPANRSATDQAILEAGQGRVKAIQAYYDAIVSGSKEKISQAVRDLVAAENHWTSVVGTLGEGSPLTDAFGTLFETTEIRGRDQVESTSELWKGLIAENAKRAEELIDEVGSKLAQGKITWAQARQQLFSGLKDLGVDVNTIGEALGQTFQGALLEAVNEVAKAVEELIKVIRRLRGEVANPIGGGTSGTPPRVTSYAPLRGTSVLEGPGGIDAGATARFLTSAAAGAGAPSSPSVSPMIVRPSVTTTSTAAAAAAAPRVNIPVTVNVEGSVRADTDLAAAIAEPLRNEFIRASRSTGAGSRFFFAE